MKCQCHSCNTMRQIEMERRIYELQARMARFSAATVSTEIAYQPTISEWIINKLIRRRAA